MAKNQKNEITYEQAVKRLDEIVELLDNGELTLENSLELFSEGAKLISYCNTTLDSARLKIEKLFPEEEADA